MAPKKGHGPRNFGGGGTKKPPPPTDDDYIVFTNGKDKPKKANADKPDDKAKGAATDEQPKQPSTKAIIGGASWTGKLPVNLLSEKCQKNKWEKPEYTMSKTADGYSSMVILKTTNPKTKEKIILPPFKLPPTHKQLAVCETALEARHFAATYALFRISSMLNIHMTLPPKYRDLWKAEFAELKREDEKEGRGWMYAADPFATQIEREEAKATMTKKREETERRKAQEAARMPTRGPFANGGGANVMKGWNRVPKVELGKRVRMDIEELVRSSELWNPHAIEISRQQRDNIVREFSGLGFRRSHIEEAVTICKDREETLEWLLIHVPEDDLPSWSFPEGYTAGISLASSDLAREAKLKRLAAAGYSPDLCVRALDHGNGDEGSAAGYLQAALFGASDDNDLNSQDDSGDEQWLEEQTTLEAILGERYNLVSPNICQIQAGPGSGSKPVNLQFRQPSIRYPARVPVLSVLSNALPAYIRLSITRQAVQHATESLLGEQMIFNMVDWLETNMASIIESPGSLRAITAPSTQPTTESKKHKVQLTHRLRNSRASASQAATEQSQSLLIAWRERQSTSAQQKMLVARQLLPAWNLKDKIVQAVNQHQFTIISGETGSGKSTQAVQFVLDDLIGRNSGSNANILCTQPRRISALSLADRVSDERCGKVGDEVGYIIRGDSKRKDGATKITFMTTGVLLRQMQSSSINGNALAGVSHICIDEVHERSLDTDYLLNLLRDFVAVKRDLKVILMSATLDAQAFIQYFGGKDKVGLVEIPGRAFPVQDFYLDDVVRMTGFQPKFFGRYEAEEEAIDSTEDVSLGKMVRSVGMGINYDLIASTVRHIDEELGARVGGILIFLPGTMEIDRCLNVIRQIPDMHALPLHASLIPTEQRRVFLPAPRGKRKVIAATNVAETSITIDDIVAVIDTGRVKETSYDPKDNMVRLEEVWASQAACKQRRGRAGRVRAGTCYKLFTRAAEANMASRPEPEIRRVPLEQLCLSVKAMGEDRNVSEFLARTLTPPEAGAVDGALDLLHRMGALDSGQMTALGRHLSMIPADLRCAKLMVYGSIFSCVEATITMAAILTVKSPFVSPRDKRDEAREARSTFPSGDGDLLLDLAAYQEWTARMERDGYRQVQSWCSANFLSPQTLRDISSNRAQFVSSLKDAGIISIDYHGNPNARDSSLNRHNENTQLLRALVAGALSPQIARIDFPDKKFMASMSGAVEMDPEARTIKYFNQENGRVFVHPSSMLFDAQGFSGSAAYVSYFTKMATSKTFIRDLTPFNAYGALLFSGPITVDTNGRGLLVDGWLRLRGWARIGVLISRLRMILDDVLAKKIEEPALDLGDYRIIGIVRKLVELNGMDQ